MAQGNGIGLDPDKEIVGCTDPGASNYNPLATLSCGPSGPYTAGGCSGGGSPGSICSGCCVKTISSGGGGPDLDDIGSDVEFVISDDIFCPELSTIQFNLDGTITEGGPDTSLSETCCTRDYLGVDVSYILIGNKPFCMLVQEAPCPPFETLQMGVDQVTIISIKTENCCTEEVVGVPVYWEGKNCKLLPISGDCLYNEIFVQQLEIDVSPKIEQVFGINDANEQMPLNENCCTEEVAGFSVVWNSELNLCQKTPPEQGSTTITLNEEIIIANDCDDLLISTKLYFTEPTDECLSDISASLLPDNGAIIVEQLGIFDSATDGFNTWVDLGVRLTNTTNYPFNINLVINGVTDCCEYDIRVDNIRVDCYKEEDRIFYLQSKCAGFDLARVIDNKKSWVYNPGSFTGVTLEDVNIVKHGDENLIQGFGVINRTFAPSVDADLPWRYTDYYEQSNILEPHSKLVMNSKEMELTFNMCNECCVSFSECPEGYTLSADTKSCYKITSTDGYYTDGCQLPNNSIFVTPDGEVLYRSSEPICGFQFDAYTSGAITGATGGDAEDAGLLVSAGAVTVLGIGLAGECFGPATGACTTFTTAGCGTLVNIGTTAPITYIDNPSFSTCGGGNLPMTIVSGTTTTSGITTVESGSYCIETASLLQLEEYKKVFQSFWVRMIEQFVPATTIFVSGEKWCNNDKFICTEIEECDYDYEYVESEITVIEYGTDFPPSSGTTSGTTNGGDTNEGNNSDTDIDNEAEGTPYNTDDGPITDGPIIVITNPQEPNGNTTTTRSQTVDNPSIDRQKAQYYGGLIKGREKIIFK